jgi:RNA polymerase sigma-70 factor (ECF subfamily)
MSEPTAPRPNPAADALLVTTELLRRAKQGDAHALDVLTARYLPRLERWASGRLPAYARSLVDTTDVVQDTLLKAIQALDGIEVRGPGGFQAYVRQAVLNRIRDQIRWARRRPGPDGLPEDLQDRAPSPLEQAIGRDLVERYERALATLSEDERQLLHLRIELDFSFPEIATLTGRSSPDAVRMAVRRSLARLAAEMGRDA